MLQLTGTMNMMRAAFPEDTVDGEIGVDVPSVPHIGPFVTNAEGFSQEVGSPPSGFLWSPPKSPILDLQDHPGGAADGGSPFKVTTKS